MNALLQLEALCSGDIHKEKLLSCTQAISKGLPVNYGGLSVGAGGEVIPMLTLDSMGLHNVSIIKVGPMNRAPRLGPVYISVDR